MFVAIYRWRLHPEREQDFIVNWQRITRLGYTAGSGGSSLFRNAQGVWVAIARWPSRATRDHFFEQMDAAEAESDLSKRARLAVIERLPEEELDCVLDCWTALPETTMASSP
jgi:hypothetical protein